MDVTCAASNLTAGKKSGKNFFLGEDVDVESSLAFSGNLTTTICCFMYL